MTELTVNLGSNWSNYLSDDIHEDSMNRLLKFLSAEKAAGKTVYPAWKDTFSALNMTSPEQVKVVILGQDPYHGPDQAHGLSFSVPKGQKIPPSLRNIYKELCQDLGCDAPPHGCLTSWAEQGVLLLNSVLTVRRGEAASHKNRGWEQFTDAVINVVNVHQSGVVFMLWGAYAQNKGQVIDSMRHLVLQGPHPSPLSAHRGFFGCQHFSQANKYLIDAGHDPIDWQIR